MKNIQSDFREKRLVMFAGEVAGQNAEAPKDPTAKMGEFVPPKTEELSVAGRKDPEVKEEAKKISKPKNDAEAQRIYDRYVKPVYSQVIAFQQLETRFDSGGRKDAKLKRKLIAAVEALGGEVNEMEYFPKPSNALFQTPKKDEYGYGDMQDFLGDYPSDTILGLAADDKGYEWMQFTGRMVALKKRSDASKAAYDKA